MREGLAAGAVWLGFLGMIAILVGAFIPGPKVGDFRHRSLAVRRKALRVPVGRIADAREGLVAFVGRAVFDETLAPAAVYAPITGRPALWFRCTVVEEIRTGNRTEWRQLANFTAGGRVRLVEPTGASAVVDASQSTSHGMEQAVFLGTLAQFTPQAGALFTQLRLPPPPNPWRVYRVEEEIIQPDDEVYCVGPARVTGPLAADYRTAPGHVAIEGSSVLTRQSPAVFAQSTRRESRRARVQTVLVAAGAAGMGLAAVLGFASHLVS